MTNPALAPKRAERLLSLDVLRGVTIAFMIMVNNNGGAGSWGFMNHAAWNGLTPTDLVFPTFLFVVGASIVFAFDARLRRGATRIELTLHTLRRGAVLFLLGIVVNGFPAFELEHLRIYGVLQRIAVCYVAVGLFYLWDRRVWTKVAVAAVALAGYWALLRWVPIPGAGMPGRDIAFLDPDLNLTAWIDRHVMPYHLYEDWTTHNLRDPEGLLSDLPAVGTALLGLLTGLWLRGDKTKYVKSLGMAAGSLACLASGYLWSVWFPLNKKMWTSSYVLVAAGWSLAAFAAAYWAIEQKGWGKERGRRWIWPWLVFGSNAIVAYLISELLPGVVGLLRFRAGGRRTDALAWLFNHAFARVPDRGWGTFGFSVTFLAICFVPVWILYRKKIFVKV